MNSHRRLPARLVEEAATLLVAREQISRLMRGDHDGGPTIKRYLALMGRAKGTAEFIHHAPAAPQMGMNRPLTVGILSYNGTYRACVLPNLASLATIRGYLDKAHAGLLDQERVWGDPRYIGQISQCFGPDGPHAWWSVDSLRGATARAAWAALILERLRQGRGLDGGDLEKQLRANLFETERSAGVGGPAIAFSTEGDPFAACWTSKELDRILQKKAHVALDHARPPTIPIDLFRHRAGLGYGEVIAYWLARDPQGPGLSQTETAYAMGLSDRKAASRLAAMAKRKIGQKTSLLQMIPPWPASTLSSSDTRSDTSATPPRNQKIRRGGETMAKSSPKNGPSTTRSKSGGGRGNNPPKGK